MAKRSLLGFLVSGHFWLTLIKSLLIAFVLLMLYIQIPELRYDTLGGRPIDIGSPEDIVPELLRGSSFARVRGTANLENAFVYERYGLQYTYFTLDPYGLQIIARRYGSDVESWEGQTLFEGKLKPFDSQPFSYVIRDIFADQNGVSPSPDAFFLGVGDVPAANGWQIGSVALALVMLAAMVYFFFFFRRDKQKRWFSDPLDYLKKDPAVKGGEGADESLAE